MLTMTHFDPDGTPSACTASDLVDALGRPDGTTWIDMESPTDDEFEAVSKQFDWHPLAIDDMRVETHLPKVDDFGNHLLLVVHAAAFDERGRFDTIEMEIFLGEGYLVTHHSQPIPALAALHERCWRNHAVATKGPAYLLYLLVDGMADVYLPYLEMLDDRVDDLEEEILERPTRQTQGEIYALKRDVIKLRRIVLPQAEVLRRLGRGEFPILPEASEMYFRDVHDHLWRVSEEANSYRDLLTAALDSYLSAVSNDMNQVMKVLTVFSSIFIPLTFLAGIWGMNFEHMPELHLRHGYAIAITTMVAAGLTVAGFFKRKGWM